MRREIAELIGVSAATVTREVQRNANTRGRYTHRHAQVLADERKERERRNRSVILTLVERYTGLILMARVAEGKAPRAVPRTAVLLLAPYKGKIRSITTDNGTEFRDHQYITERLGARVCFADSYASCQKGTIEYSNKLIRHYVIKMIILITYRIKS